MLWEGRMGVIFFASWIHAQRPTAHPQRPGETRGAQHGSMLQRPNRLNAEGLMLWGCLSFHFRSAWVCEPMHMHISITISLIVFTAMDHNGT